MKAQKITKEVIENLPDGDYAIFKDNQLVTIWGIVNSFGHHPIYYPFLIGENYGYNELREEVKIADEYDIEDCYIILASEIKLKQYACPNDVGVCFEECQGDCLNLI